MSNSSYAYYERMEDLYKEKECLEKLMRVSNSKKVIEEIEKRLEEIERELA